MDVHRLDAHQAAELRAAPYTYEDVGATAAGAVAGFTWVERSAILERRDFEGAAGDLLSWQVQARSGMHVWASPLPLEAASLAVLRLGPGRLSLRIPCRVVYVIDEPDLKGFAYGTLPGHPVVGEERFALRRLGDGRLELTISAFSRPASRLAKLGGPVSRMVQSAMIGRYLRALDKR
ncbi:DUF1990 domain-containing protein [Nocardioides sp.]|uniref:DUF1990 family protein n=1 Tax=Nocardioides sp. TaxID=35761 RepID=UPI002B7A9D93|nr:DUF1990 domain-containing protein [Nocardioides sp.]HXH81220.1 DUF1990 domain-containing protein [Nocardioides sp.]